MKIESGKAIPNELREVIKDVTNFNDWVLVASSEGYKTSASTLRNILGGMVVTEQSRDTVFALVEHANKKIEDQKAKADKQKKVLKSYLLQNA